MYQKAKVEASEKEHIAAPASTMLADEPQRQLSSSKPPSPLVFLLISTHFTATLGIPLTPPTL